MTEKGQYYITLNQINKRHFPPDKDYYYSNSIMVILDGNKKIDLKTIIGG